MPRGLVAFWPPDLHVREGVFGPPRGACRKPLLVHGSLDSGSRCPVACASAWLPSPSALHLHGDSTAQPGRGRVPSSPPAAMVSSGFPHKRSLWRLSGQLSRGLSLRSSSSTRDSGFDPRPAAASLCRPPPHTGPSVHLLLRGPQPGRCPGIKSGLPQTPVLRDQRRREEPLSLTEPLSAELLGSPDPSPPPQLENEAGTLLHRPGPSARGLTALALGRSDAHGLSRASAHLRTCSFFSVVLGTEPRALLH